MPIPFDKEKIDVMLLGKDGVAELDAQREALIASDPTKNQRSRYFLHRNCQVSMANGEPLIGWVQELDALGIHLILGPDPGIKDPPRAIVFWDAVSAIEELVARDESAGPQRIVPAEHPAFDLECLEDLNQPS